MYHPSSSQKGFTLVELLVYIALFLVILGSVYGILEANRSTYVSGERKADVQQNARVAMDEIARQLRMAGYVPENFDTNAANDIANVNPIHVATDSGIAIFGDSDATGASSVHFFCLDGSVVRRGSGATGAAASYTCNTGEILAENVTSFRLLYYAADNSTLPATPTPPYQLDAQGLGAVPSFSDVTQRGAVRRIVVMLTVSQTVPRRAPQTYTLTSDVRLRNVN